MIEIVNLKPVTPIQQYFSKAHLYEHGNIIVAIFYSHNSVELRPINLK